MPFAIKVILELGAIFALLYGFYHEKEVIAFEDRLLAAFRSGKEQKKVQQHTVVSAYPEEASYDEREARALEAEANRRAAAALKAAEERKAARKQAARQNAQRKAYAQDASFVA